MLKLLKYLLESLCSKCGKSFNVLHYGSAICFLLYTGYILYLKESCFFICFKTKSSLAFNLYLPTQIEFINKNCGKKMLQGTQTMSKDFGLGLEDFNRDTLGDVLVEKVNISRATFKEAQDFKDRLVYDIMTNNLKVIIDLSSCEYIDSTFLGVLVVVLKKMGERGGEIKYIIPQPSALYLFKLTGLYSVLNLYKNIDEAMQSFA